MRWFFSGMILFLSSLLQAGEPQYRLSGIIAPEGGDAIAIIEFPEGEEQVFRAGDIIGSGFVVAVSRHSVKLNIDGSEQFIYLEGVESDDEVFQLPATLSDTISKDIIEKLANLSDRQGKKAKKNLDYALKAALGLPQDAIITQVNDASVGSSQAVIQRLISLLRSDDPAPIAFSISGVDNMDRVYRFLKTEEQALE